MDTIDFTKIAFAFRDLGEKKVFKNSLKKINSNKKLFLYYSRYRNVPICTLPKLRLILSSRTGFLSFCFNFYSFMHHNNNTLDITPENIIYISNCVVAHEIGHILDPNISQTRSDYATLLNSFIDKILFYNINIEDKNIHKSNLPQDLEDCVLNLKRNLIKRECDAWDIAHEILPFSCSDEEILFYKIKEYALATYNFGNISTIIKEHKLDTYLKYMKSFAPTG